jgi:catechol-2,3-dioxygenase
MPVRGFDHYNLRASRDRLDRLRDFYRDVVGLVEGERPAFRRFGYWLYVGSYPVLHLSEGDADESAGAGGGGGFNHAAFHCTRRDEFEQRLTRLGVSYRVARVPQTRQVQLFFDDPAGNGIELIFDAAESATTD